MIGAETQLGPTGNGYARVSRRWNGPRMFICLCGLGGMCFLPGVRSKYLHVIGIGIQNTLVYRANFFFRAAFSLIPLIGTMMLWRAVYDGKAGAQIGNYDFSQMITYYLIVMVVDALTAVTDDDWQIAGDIKDGNISQFLLKPINYLIYRLCLFFSGRLVYTLSAAIPVGLFLAYHHANLVYPKEALTWVIFLTSLLLTAVLQFMISCTMAFLAFWVLEVGTFVFILFAIENIAGGHLFPLDILPAWLLQLLQFTPFPYLLYFPVSIYLGHVHGQALINGLLIQAAWVVTAILLARFVWGRGIQKYSAVGG